MKTLIAFFWVTLTISAVAAAKEDDRHHIQARMNGLDSLSEKLFPRIGSRLGLDRLRLPDQQLVDTSWNGYSVTVTLRDIQGAIPPEKLRVAFAPGNLLEARINAPEARVKMQLAVSIDSHRWYQPGLSTEFTVTGSGFSGVAAAALGLTNGDLQARVYSISKLEIGRVEVEDIGLLSKIFGTVLRHTNMCGGTRSLEDCMTRTVNKQLARMLTPERFLKPLVDPLLAEASRAIRAVLAREDKNASFDAGLVSFQTSAETATFGLGLRLRPKGEPAFCASELEPSKRARDELFDWNRRATGDLETALPLSLVEDYLYAFARRGSLCYAGEADYLGTKLGLEIAPSGSISIVTSASGELVLRIPLRANISAVPGERASIEASNLHAALELGLEFENGSPKGLCLAARHAALVDLRGSVAFSGLRVPLAGLQSLLEQELSTALVPKLGKMCFVPKTIALDPFVAVELGDRTEAAPAHVWTSFAFRNRSGVY